jgi:hypothetical protein
VNATRPPPSHATLWPHRRTGISLSQFNTSNPPTNCFYENHNGTRPSAVHRTRQPQDIASHITVLRTSPWEVSTSHSHHHHILTSSHKHTYTICRMLCYSTNYSHSSPSLRKVRQNSLKIISTISQRAHGHHDGSCRTNYDRKTLDRGLRTIWDLKGETIAGLLSHRDEHQCSRWR